MGSFGKFQSFYLLILLLYFILIFLYVRQSFFLIHIQKLRTAVGVDFKLEDLRFPLLCPVLEKIRKISYNHKPNYIDNVKDILMHLDEGIN